MVRLIASAEADAALETPPLHLSVLCKTTGTPIEVFIEKIGLKDVQVRQYCLVLWAFRLGHLPGVHHEGRQRSNRESVGPF